jgi:hypothetical protein
MRKAILMSAIVAFIASGSGLAFAAQASKAKAAAATTTSTAKPMSATGKIVKFDESTKALTLSTANGEETFTLGSSVKLHEGAKAITASNLSTLTGREAKVRYTAAGSDKSAESVMVSPAPKTKSSTK